MSHTRRLSIHLRTILIVLAGLATAFFPQAYAHEGKTHESPPGNSSDSVQQFAIERLVIPDVPVIDTAYRSQGFISRFADAGVIVVGLTYTGCETLCPISNLIMQQLDNALVKSSESKIHIVTLSIDPARDTPDALRQMAERLNASDHWTWLTAAPKHSRMLLDSLDVKVAELEQHDPMFLVGNVATGRFIRVIGMPDPEQLLTISRSAQL